MSNVIDLDEMSPAEIIALADSVSDGARQRKPYERHIEIGGVSVDIDMRRVKDVRTIALVARADKGDELAIVELFDFILGDQREAVIEQMSDEDGYCSAEDYMRFCAAVMQECGAKN